MNTPICESCGNAEPRELQRETDGNNRSISRIACKDDDACALRVYQRGLNNRDTTSRP